jgi:hypothetical protein
MPVRISTLVAFFFCLAFTFSLSGQERKLQNADVSCGRFVQEFYSWYLANSSKNPERDGGVALQRRSYLFSPAIVEALRKDDEAQVKAGSDLVSGLPGKFCTSASETNWCFEGPKFTPYGTGRRMKRLT